MNATGIPPTFQLAGHTLKVKVIKPSRWKHGKNAVGMFLPDSYEIHILSSTTGSNRQQVFVHELCHALLTIAGHDALSSDEDFVDRLGHLLQQALSTFA